MTYDAKTPEDYIKQVPEERQDALKKLRKTINDNLPNGFKECINYNMIGYVVPHEIYPDGYHCDPKLPLPFMSFASQKNSINFYHSGIYAKPELHDWFVNEYPKHNKRKLDMGKSCVRFKKIDEIPYDLIAELVQKMTVEEWISIYESVLKKK
ncbi:MULTISPECIES: DUF1801 domain-containing protein [unclassified Mesoflavibacter]|jgi:uncharacterized protein YdhG (YjbR/CyaY superfamily)|uniref:DUF1801 domain-containing protein n=1 Tax=unclassified Mesoflavibacter TaxID=2630131 RepID=UPI001CA93568|nr:DUF1801 domain-containing protein [Mesoflavibacter sp. SCSIO 43206]MCP4052947.1 DUF1801 domain-containing protein [Mesoflavibacter sp.]UAB76665.1 DUF1801 domain-containing protein [Mesoflavibacter sp. SCSIO 43206]